MTEHELQRCLTRRWARDGLLIDGERLMLVAWEVMPGRVWRINDSASYWASPSIDFLAIDARGGLAAIEVKPGRLRATKTAWGALCQVTHRALLIGRQADLTKVVCVHDQCGGGAGRRTPEPAWEQFGERHATFFDRAEPIDCVRRRVRRVIVAESADPSFFDVLDEFNRSPLTVALEQLRATYRGTSGFAAREFTRLDAALPAEPEELDRPVCFEACGEVT